MNLSSEKKIFQVWENTGNLERITVNVYLCYDNFTFEKQKQDFPGGSGPQLCKPTRLEPVLRNKRSHRNEKPAHRNEE